ncbi:uncharacterized protein LOC124278633 [Haliotis rubra]|uniref:uncharacterized protein LOC124278633 n=1 Tax=Haliotis rubra TaxID=36100 RepID=UPI001EE5856C|nr:uncharacterized protein LOC124278633 [Haliotis rubra]
MCNFLCLFVLVCLIGLNAAWVGRSDQKPIAWAPSRRSIYCVKTGQECLQTSQCCSPGDVCLTSTKYTKYGGKKYMASTCRNVEELARHMPPYKKAGQQCKDSLECLDLCCREVRGHRYGVFHVCGKPEDRYMSYRCRTNVDVRSENEVIDTFGGYNKINPWA